MQTAAPEATHDDRSLQLSGVVVLTDGVVGVVRTQHGDVRTVRAASCLLEPAPGDRVLVASSSAEAFVLAVLVRERAGSLRIMSDESVEIVSRKGSVTLLGSESVDVIGGQAVTVTSKSVEVEAAEGRLRANKLSVLGKVADVSVEVLRTAADAMERTAGRLVERLGRSYRFIEDTESVRARELDMRADAALSLRAEHAVILARKIVKVDGTQIHMG